jgi:hypothetical protein
MQKFQFDKSSLGDCSESLRQTPKTLIAAYFLDIYVAKIRIWGLQLETLYVI